MLHFLLIILAVLGVWKLLSHGGNINSLRRQSQRFFDPSRYVSDDESKR